MVADATGNSSAVRQPRFVSSFLVTLRRHEGKRRIPPGGISPFDLSRPVITATAIAAAAAASGKCNEESVVSRAHCYPCGDPAERTDDAKERRSVMRRSQRRDHVSCARVRRFFPSSDRARTIPAVFPIRCTSRCTREFSRFPRHAAAFLAGRRLCFFAMISCCTMHDDTPEDSSVIRNREYRRLV